MIEKKKSFKNTNTKILLQHQTVLNAADHYYKCSSVHHSGKKGLKRTDSSLAEVNDFSSFWMCSNLINAKPMLWIPEQNLPTPRLLVPSTNLMSLWGSSTDGQTALRSTFCTDGDLPQDCQYKHTWQQTNLPFILAVQLNRYNALTDDARVECADGQFLSNITSLAEIHAIHVVKVGLQRQRDFRP